MSRDGAPKGGAPRNPFSSLANVLKIQGELASREPQPAEFWRAVFMAQEDRKFRSPGDPDWTHPDDVVSPRPPGFVLSRPRSEVPDRPFGVEDQRYLGSFKVTEATEAENRKRWRELVLTHGEGTYYWYDTLDEAGEKPATRFGRKKMLFIYESDLDAFRLGIGEEALSDETVAELEATYMADVLKGDARKAEILAVEYRRRGDKKAALRVAGDGRKADDHDDGIWKNYDEDRRAQRNIDRRLLELSNGLVGGAGALYNTRDCGEANPKRDCAKCGKAGALGSDYSIGCVLLCYVCRRLPRSEWPAPKPIEIQPFFRGFEKFEKTDAPPRPLPPIEMVNYGPSGEDPEEPSS